MSTYKKPAKLKPFRKITMSVPLNFEEVKLLQACFPFEDGLTNHVRRSKKKKKDVFLDLILTKEERREVLDALEAKSFDFSILHDKIMILTPENLGENKHVGSSFDQFLREEGTCEEVQRKAKKRAKEQK